MPKISEDIIRAVTDAAKIEDVVGDFVTLRICQPIWKTQQWPQD